MVSLWLMLSSGLYTIVIVYLVNSAEKYFYVLPNFEQWFDLFEVFYSALIYDKKGFQVKKRLSGIVFVILVTYL